MYRHLFKYLNKSNDCFTVLINKREFIRFPFKGGNSKRKHFHEKCLVGFSKEKLFEVVTRVEDYNKFLPFCNKSQVIHREPNFIKASLEIGFPPFTLESYVSHVKLVKPNYVSARCFDGHLFEYLNVEWKFNDGLKNNDQTCNLEVTVDFEFKSELHSLITSSIFDELARQIRKSFVKRASELYGKPSISSPS